MASRASWQVPAWNWSILLPFLVKACAKTEPLPEERGTHGTIAIANRIFETCLYDLFLSEKEMNSRIFKAGSLDKNQFVQNGILDMDLVLKKFMVHWNDLYHSADEKFIEENGRKPDKR